MCDLRGQKCQHQHVSLLWPWKFRVSHTRQTYLGTEVCKVARSKHYVKKEYRSELAGARSGYGLCRNMSLLFISVQSDLLTIDLWPEAAISCCLVFLVHVWAHQQYLLFIRVSSNRMKGNGLELRECRVRLHLRKTFFSCLWGK